MIWTRNQMHLARSGDLLGIFICRFQYWLSRLQCVRTDISLHDKSATFCVFLNLKSMYVRFWHVVLCDVLCCILIKFALFLFSGHRQCKIRVSSLFSNIVASRSFILVFKCAEYVHFSLFESQIRGNSWEILRQRVHCSCIDRYNESTAHLVKQW